MKTALFYLFLFLSILMIGWSCKKDNNISYQEFLSDKSILQIMVMEDDTWIVSTANNYYSHEGLRCYIPPGKYVTRVTGNEFEYMELKPFFSELIKDKNQALYVSKNNEIFRFQGISKLERYMKHDSLYIFDFNFNEKNELFFTNDSGLFKKTGNNIFLYEAANNLHNLIIGPDNRIWLPVSEGFYIFSEIQSQFLNYHSISVLEPGETLDFPIIDGSNNLWFTVSTNSGTSVFLRYDGNSWHREIPLNDTYGFLNSDSEGNIWYIHNNYDNGAATPYLQLYRENTWVPVDIAFINKYVNCLDKKGNTLYIGTSEGIRIIETSY